MTTDSTRQISDAYSHQLSILDRSYHPSGTFIEFKKDEIEQSVPSRFEQQVCNYPNRLAIKTNKEELTYRELNQAANRVAHVVMERCGTEEEPMALMFEQGSQAITAILGVLKAGKIFVSLDPRYPHSRISYMVKELEARLILTNSLNLSKARELATDRCELINVDELDPGLSTENPRRPISPDAIVSIVYTSGSTGQPKGVMQNHRNLLYSIMLNTNALHISSLDRLSFLHTPTIGASRDIFGALLNGAALYPFDLQIEGVGRLAKWLIQNEITIYHSVPTAFRTFVATLTGEEQFPKLRQLYVGGEPLHQTDVALYAQRFSRDCVLSHTMGATEAHTWQWYFIDTAAQVPGSTVPLGYDFFEGAEVLLLDDDGEEVGVNLTGEIAVRSRYLSPGYWKRPDLTQAAFLDDPGGGDERTYLTGDLGRMLPDGCLEHLGRKDSQVKVRGHRVALTEIETILLGLDNVKEAAIVTHEDPSGAQRLVAYLVPNRLPSPTVTHLRRALRDTLPDYMVPSAFVFLETMPLLPGGKVDRSALLKPRVERPDLDSQFFPPQTQTEEALVTIWREVLGLDRVGIHDNFLELGGDSLMAGQVISRVIKSFRLELPLRSLFEAPTVANMALVIVQTLAQKANQDEVELMLADLETISDEQAKQAYVDDGS